MAFSPLQTIEDTLADCGVLADMNNIIVDGCNLAQIISAEVFNKSFTACLVIEFAELEDSWKTYRNFSVDEGRIRLRPSTKVNIRHLSSEHAT